MKKLVFIQNTILHYRKSFYNKLSQFYEVTVIHSGGETVESGDSYSEVIIPMNKIGPFFLQKDLKDSINNLNPNYIIGMFDLRWIHTFMLLSRKQNWTFLWWGLDTGNNKIATIFKVLIARLGYPIIFYNNFNKDKMNKFGLGNSSLFVANNTFDVGSRVKSYLNPVKNKILFVGSFDFRKRNDVLLNTFSSIISKIPNEIQLLFVGDGDEKSNIEALVKKLGIGSRVIFSGRVDDADKLATYYKEAIFSVSYGQAGLSVLQSLGFGVPYLTKGGAISGGEISNIIHGENGYFCDNSESLKSNMLNLILDLDLSRRLGKNAYDYYSSNCSIENMAQGFVDAINKVTVPSTRKNNWSVNEK